MEHLLHSLFISQRHRHEKGTKTSEETFQKIELKLEFQSIFKNSVM